MVSRTQILVWFNDRPARECYYSLHNMARTGTFLDKKIGEWFGPSTTAYVLRCGGGGRACMGVDAR